MTVVAEPSGITIRIESFEGPLDLLLHLCRTEEMDLTRVPVRTITDQYLAHLESVRFQDLETAGAFMVIAATLIYLKSKLLLPASPDLTIRNRFGGVSVIPASERGHVDYVRRVVKTDIDVNHVNDLGWTAMLEAIVLGDGSTPYQEIVGILLESLADLLPRAGAS